MKKRKKRRSKTEGGDKLPFDDEMLALPGVNVADLCIISELQKSIKANKVISYLSGKTEVKEETKGADYGGTT